ncbi:hypothetical protein MVEN_00726400 [Mycena venus]|uniref:Uncharacterized protein n=1 Tax=Mycena venus TaxID=2733690 RepID=A0A8H6YHQ7_9AGAR|nr:hypothetical protein MVEN_00726400 [Mycena venus]
MGTLLAPFTASKLCPLEAGARRYRIGPWFATSRSSARLRKRHQSPLTRPATTIRRLTTTTVWSLPPTWVAVPMAISLLRP